VGRDSAALVEEVVANLFDALVDTQANDLLRSYDPAQGPWGPYLHRLADWQICRYLQEEQRQRRCAAAGARPEAQDGSDVELLLSELESALLPDLPPGLQELLRSELGQSAEPAAPASDAARRQQLHRLLARVQGFIWG
jgi:hypothetical protein